MRKYILLNLLLLCAVPSARAQYYGVRVNALALATGTINAGLEASIREKLSLDLPIYWNPIRTDKLQMKFLAVQPGIRRWLYREYVGPFVAGHLAAAWFDTGGRTYRYKGHLFGVGSSVGYTWLLGKRLNLTAETGLGIYYLKDRRTRHVQPDNEDIFIRERSRTLLAPSKAEITFTYLF